MSTSKRQQDVKPREKPSKTKSIEKEEEKKEPPKSILERLKAYMELKFPATLNELAYIKDEEEIKEAEQEQLQEMMTFFLDQM